jgi:hypothetical protein
MLRDMCETCTEQLVTQAMGFTPMVKKQVLADLHCPRKAIGNLQRAYAKPGDQPLAYPELDYVVGQGHLGIVPAAVQDRTLPRDVR